MIYLQHQKELKLPLTDIQYVNFVSYKMCSRSTESINVKLHVLELDEGEMRLEENIKL